MKAARNKLSGGTTQALSVPQGFQFLYDQLLFNEGKALLIDQGKFHEKETVLQPTTKLLLESFLSLNGCEFARVGGLIRT